MSRCESIYECRNSGSHFSIDHQGWAVDKCLCIIHTNIALRRSLQKPSGPGEASAIPIRNSSDGPHPKVQFFDWLASLIKFSLGETSAKS